MDELLRPLFPLVMRHLELGDQKKVSELSKKFNDWSYGSPQWTADQSINIEAIRSELTQLYTDYSRRTRKDKDMVANAAALQRQIPSGIDELLDTHSTLFGRSFVAKVKQDPASFVKSGNLTPRVVAVLEQIPEAAIAAIDLELSTCQCPMDVIKLHEEGKLEDFINENRTKITKEYKLEQELFGEGDSGEPDDKMLLEFASTSVKDYYAAQITVKQKQLLALKQDLAKNLPLKEPIIHSDPASPRKA
ncbi:MAG TPA: hypothetical protein VGV92_05075 [Gammaproteobacteria bacterium]|nr:hypothetical protein [Gammaproteobacteria bacterium]